MVSLELEEVVVSSQRVLDGEEPIRMVTRQWNGVWQFVSARELDDTEAIGVHAYDLLHEDPTLKRVTHLCRGELAYRKGPDDEWRIISFSSAEEMDYLIDNGLLPDV